MSDAHDSSHPHLTARSEHGATGNVHWLTLRRAERLNVLDSALIGALVGALDVVARDGQARAAVLCAEGTRAWIGGADIGEMVGLDRAAARAFITRLHELCCCLRELPVPVLARIEGFCLGAGLEVAASCDVRIAAEGSRFGMPEVQVGVPSVIEAALLPRLIGSGRARDLVLTGRIVDAGTAAAWGLVDEVVAPGRLGTVLAARLEAIAGAAPQAVRAQKRLCRQWEELPLAEAVAAGIDAFADAYAGDEPRRYMRRFLDRPRRGAEGTGESA